MRTVSVRRRSEHAAQECRGGLYARPIPRSNNDMSPQRVWGAAGADAPTGPDAPAGGCPPGGAVPSGVVLPGMRVSMIAVAVLWAFAASSGPISTTAVLVRVSTTTR